MAAVSSFGRFRDRYGITKMPRAQKNGYVKVQVNGKASSLHVLVCAAFHGLKPSLKHEVDHVDMNPGNNKASNLRWITKSENIRASWAKNLNRRSDTASRSKPVLARKMGMTEWKRYESANAAARYLGVNPGTISKIVGGKGFRAGGYEFVRDIPNEPVCYQGEVWKHVERSNAAVSSYGRFRDSHGISKLPRAGKNGYVKVQVDGKSHLLHVLVCAAFHGSKPSPKHEVDHVEMNPGNNSASNRRWVTHSENIRASWAMNPNRQSNVIKSSKPVLARRVGALDEWQRYESFSDAARCLGVNSGTISKIVCGNGSCTGGYEFVRDAPHEPDCFEGEVWKLVA